MTRCADEHGFELVTLPSGACSVKSLGYREIFHPVIGPAQEARLLYADQLQLARRAKTQAPRPLVLWDVGLGIGANALAAIGICREARASAQIYSFDTTNAGLAFALQHASHLPHLDGHHDAVNQLLDQGRARWNHNGASITWHFVRGDFPDWLNAYPNRLSVPPPQAILFDPCSPARNPEMWTADLFQNLFASLNPALPCVLATYSRATHVRVGLLLAGFFVGAGLPAGAKEETTLAANQRSEIAQLLDRRWLDKARISSSAEPLSSQTSGSVAYRQAPLSDLTWQRLRNHPQFRAETQDNPGAG